jgi:AcrR family transcriptional regulator
MAGVPRLWSETIEMHRDSVRDALLDTTAQLVAEEGLASVTMSKIAKGAGIGRATLYRYFPDVEAILLAWHERQVTAHLAELSLIRDRSNGALPKLTAVLRAFALISHARHEPELVAVLHRGQHVVTAHQRLSEMLEELLRDAARDGEIRHDIPAAELVSYCLHALSAASTLSSQASVERLVAVTLAGMSLSPAGPEGGHHSKARTRRRQTPNEGA